MRLHDLQVEMKEIIGLSFQLIIFEEYLVNRTLEKVDVVNIYKRKFRRTSADFGILFRMIWYEELIICSRTKKL